MHPIDRCPQGDPETVVLLPTGSLLGLYIRNSGHGDIMLGIREDRNGQPVSCAITNELTVEHPPKRHGYGYSEEDDGA